MKKYTIYVLKHPETLEIRYVGVTTNLVINRFYQHIHSAKNKYTKVAKWIFSLLNKNLRPLIEEIEICNEDNWEERERYWIAYYTNLLNQHEGGKGIIINRELSSIERSANGHHKQVCQITDNGELIKLWNSCKEATIDLGLKSRSSISNAIKNVAGCHKVKGTRWCYYEDYKTNNINLHQYLSKIDYTKLKKVYLFDNNGEFIKEYKCLNLLVKEIWPIKYSYSGARTAIKEKRKFKNYYISYDPHFKI